MFVKVNLILWSEMARENTEAGIALRRENRAKDRPEKRVTGKQTQAQPILNVSNRKKKIVRAFFCDLSCLGM